MFGKEIEFISQINHNTALCLWENNHRKLCNISSHDRFIHIHTMTSKPPTQSRVKNATSVETKCITLSFGLSCSRSEKIKICYELIWYLVLPVFSMLVKNRTSCVIYLLFVLLQAADFFLARSHHRTACCGQEIEKIFISLNTPSG